MDIIDKLLETPCYIMDFLPKQVPMNCGGQFFEVETYLLNHYDCCGLRDRFVGVILKAMCYYPVSVQWGKWIEQRRLDMWNPFAEERCEMCYCFHRTKCVALFFGFV